MAVFVCAVILAVVGLGYYALYKVQPGWFRLRAGAGRKITFCIEMGKTRIGDEPIEIAVNTESTEMRGSRNVSGGWQTPNRELSLRLRQHAAPRRRFCLRVLSASLERVLGRHE